MSTRRFFQQTGAKQIKLRQRYYQNIEHLIGVAVAINQVSDSPQYLESIVLRFMPGKTRLLHGAAIMTPGFGL